MYSAKKLIRKSCPCWNLCLKNLCTCGASLQKQPTEVFMKIFANLPGKELVGVGLKACKFIKLQQNCFTVNIVKFLRTPIYKCETTAPEFTENNFIHEYFPGSFLIFIFSNNLFCKNLQQLLSARQVRTYQICCVKDKKELPKINLIWIIFTKWSNKH